MTIPDGPRIMFNIDRLLKLRRRRLLLSRPRTHCLSHPPPLARHGGMTAEAIDETHSRFAGSETISLEVLLIVHPGPGKDDHVSALPRTPCPNRIDANPIPGVILVAPCLAWAVEPVAQTVIVLPSPTEAHLLGTLNPFPPVRQATSSSSNPTSGRDVG